MKTVKARIPLEVNERGEWQAAGSSELNEFDGDDWMEAFGLNELLSGTHVHRIWVEAEVPVPSAEPSIITGNAVEDTAAPAAEEAA